MGILTAVMTCMQQFKSNTVNKNLELLEPSKCLPEPISPLLSPRSARPRPFNGGIPKPYNVRHDWASYVHGFKTAMNRSERGRDEHCLAYLALQGTGSLEPPKESAATMVRLLKSAHHDPYFTQKYDPYWWNWLLSEFIILAGSGYFSLRGLTQDLFYLLKWAAEPEWERARFASKHPRHIGGFDEKAFYAGYLRALQHISMGQAPPDVDAPRQPAPGWWEGLPPAPPNWDQEQLKERDFIPPLFYQSIPYSYSSEPFSSSTRLSLAEEEKIDNEDLDKNEVDSKNNLKGGEVSEEEVQGPLIIVKFKTQEVKDWFANELTISQRDLENLLALAKEK